ncbi:hypothetical protein CFR75_14435 [Komagataeibacter xylinus]|uniref:Uncharacterized protein n=5 Tax=Komagataeibacter TaxID=1434011 RepID=A0A850P1I5_9PROT|nr:MULTISPECIES: hypothetical protein [Komagataeibacter]NVN37788.1 hypothetical protein [Komagataeibacter swingsii]PYD55810.1 hypothetical protein CFR75_14435 [Komagataeibacter xylinus]PYD81578.1 hypothetical protein CFR80_10970 [Komagataeibacter oboediens]
MAADLNLEQTVRDASRTLQDHAEHVFSRHSDRVEKQLKEQISALQSQLETHEQARHASHLRFYLTVAGVIALSALVHFRHRKAK